MKNRNHIDSKVLAQAAKWSKPKLRKKYTYAPKQVTVAKYLKDSKDTKLQRKYAKYMKKKGFKRKSSDNVSSDKNDKIYNKFESMNNFSNLQRENVQFAMNKNRERRENKLSKLDNLAWESVAIPENDKIFGTLDGIGNECGVGQLQVIDSKDFFENYDVNDLRIEEYVLDSNKNINIKNSYNDRMGLKNKMDINTFKNESNELLKLIQFSLYKIDPSKSTLTTTTTTTMPIIKMDDNGKNKKKKLKKRKTMKEKAEEKKLKALQKQYAEEMLFKSQNQIDEEVFDLLSINVTEIERELKMKAKQKWKQHKKKKLENINNNNNNNNNNNDKIDEPPMKKRKLNGKKGEFRKQIENLHEKQNIKQITKTWNELLINGNNRNSKSLSISSSSNELLSHLNKASMIDISSKDELSKYLNESSKTLIIIDFYALWCRPCNVITPKIEKLAIKYKDNIDFLRINVEELDDITKEYDINVMPTFLFIDQTKKEILRIEGANIDLIKKEIDKLCIKPNDNNNNNRSKQMELHPILLKGIADLGFIEATNIQKEVIPMAMDGINDILIAAATGSGKTLSFGIPIINDLLYNDSVNKLDYNLYGLIITPTRELAIQIESHLKSLLKYSTLQCISIIGGMSLSKQQRLLRSSPEIIIATPGRIWQLIEEKESLHLRDLTKLRYLVLDEADKLLSSSHFIELNHLLNVIKTIWNINDAKQYFNKYHDDIQNISNDNNYNNDNNDNNYNLMEFLEENENENENEESHIDDYEQNEKEKVENINNNKLIYNELPYRRQTFIVSATLTLESVNRPTKTESKMPIFANLTTLVPLQENIKMVDQTPRHRTTSNVIEYVIPLDIKDKDSMLTYLLQTYPGRTLIFCNTIGMVKRITLILKEMGLNVYSIHSQQQQRQRLKNLDRFINTKKCALICTDICARGLDIPSVDNIIHFQCPLSAEDYIHRTGRVGRHESNHNNNNNNDCFDGNSFLLICAQDTKLYNKIILALKRPHGLNKLIINERLLIEIRKQILISKHIASLLDENRRNHRKTSNLQKMANAAGIELDEINCRALNIMKTNNNFRSNKANHKRKYSKKNKHKSFEYGIKNNENQKNNDTNKQIKSLRNELKKLKAQNNLKTPKSSYLTKTYIS